jgi:hypothetical protein
MPYRDPHTGAPALWALLHAQGCTFEASVLPVQGDTRYRKGLEALALALYRQGCGESPTVNFGRMLRGYRFFTVIEIGEDVVEFPAASRATAVKVWEPLEILSVME